MPWSFIKFSWVILKKIYGDQFGEFVCGYWGLKGLKIKIWATEISADTLSPWRITILPCKKKNRGKTSRYMQCKGVIDNNLKNPD